MNRSCATCLAVGILSVMAGCGSAVQKPAVEPVAVDRSQFLPQDEMEMRIDATAIGPKARPHEEQSTLRPVLVTSRKARSE